MKLHLGNWSTSPLGEKIEIPMNQETIAQVRAKAVRLYEGARGWGARIPVKARVVLGLFLVAAVLMAVHTAMTAKDASLHLKVQHGFHNAQIQIWVDDELAYSGKVTGSTKKKFGLIPTDSVQGSLSQIIPVRSGPHKVRVRIEPDDAAMQEDAISGDFDHNTERDLSVSARQSRLALSWQGMSRSPVESSSNFEWLSRYASSLLLTIGGSIMSALTGYAIRELPGRLRAASEAAPKAEIGPK
ncbi:MAG TPA: hypothetical protein VFO46_13065 [Candidatus Sulfotelmatobacter sp.]|nr:hypothetical protein [Candidatus Sulfotelmatobacter sp.]